MDINDIEKIFEQEIELLELLDEVPVLLCVYDNNGYFVSLNKEWEKKLGWRREELKDTRFFELIHPDDVTKTHKIYSESIESNKKPLNGFENRYLHKDGTYKRLKWYSTLKYIHGKGLAIAVCFEDKF